jgi:hypothetical protein
MTFKFMQENCRLSFTEHFQAFYYGVYKHFFLFRKTKKVKTYEKSYKKNI